MCLPTGSDLNTSQDTTNRRNFLTLLGSTVASLAMTPAATAAPVAPPKPENVLSPDKSLQHLMEGNVRYVQGLSKRHDFKHEREALTGGQNPYAAILGCADSRIAPEYAFDSGRGDLFVVRVAGNIVNDDVIASLEYAVTVLYTPLLMVLGHDSCGAVDAAIKAVKDKTQLPGHLPSLVRSLTPAVDAVLSRTNSHILNKVIHKNVSMGVNALQSRSPLLAKAVKDNKLKIVGGVYNLSTGRVDLIG